MYEERLASRTAAQTECEYRVLHLDGTERWVRDRVSGVYQQEDGQWAMCGITDDITERKRVELERRELELQFQQTQRLEAIGTLAGGIAHDFNNILAAIIGYAELVLDGLRDEDAIESQQQVLTAAQRATDLVRQILSFSRHSKSEVHPLRVSSIVKEVMHLIRASLPSNIDVKLSLNDPDALVLAEGTQIHQILMNLCTNAGHAMEASGGRLQVSQGVQELPGAALPEGRALDPGPYLRLQVKDSGPGIPPEHMDRLFDLFFTTKEAGKGTGMGLATVQRIATELGGFVRVESAPGAGAQFDVYLPVTAQTAAGDNAGRPALPHGAERVLLVDDEATLVVMRTEGLTRLGYNVTSCFTSQEAWQRFAAAPDGFDLLVTDHMMPGLTGAELARRVLGLRPGFPVIMCSGTDSAFSKEQAQDIGMAEFLLKPVALYDLARAMRRVLEGAGRR
jgi:signal transduction histidine kinase/ActR/RegA family two-component response regulator